MIELNGSAFNMGVVFLVTSFIPELIIMPALDVIKREWAEDLFLMDARNQQADARRCRTSMLP